MKFGCSFGFFLNSAHLICRSTDISNCFSGSLRLRNNESRLYIVQWHTNAIDVEYAMSYGCTDALWFNAFFNGVSVISGRSKDDNESLCAVEPRSRFERFLPPAGRESKTARSAGQR